MDEFNSILELQKLVDKYRDKSTKLENNNKKLRKLILKQDIILETYKNECLKLGINVLTNNIDSGSDSDSTDMDSD